MSEQRFGCHCDLEPHMEPDGCVLDDDRANDCVYARILLREGKTKTDCEYWREIKTGESVSEIIARQRDLIRELVGSLEELSWQLEFTGDGLQKVNALLARARKELGE